MDWSLFGNTDQWIIVLVYPDLNKTARILFDVWAPMILYVAKVHDNNLGFSVANACCTGVDA